MGTAPALRLPQWTEYQDTEGTGRDPLGLDRVAGRFLDRALPTITTQTQRAGYYSAYCWMFEDVRRQTGRSSGRVFNSEFQKRESAFALACLAHHDGEEPPVGLAGYRRAVRRWEETSGKTHRIDFSLMKEPLGGFGSYYRSPMGRLGVLERDEAGTRATEMGQQLAADFEAAIARTSFFKKNLVEDAVVKRRDLKALGEAVCLCTLPKRAAERDKLRALFISERPDLRWQRATLLWLLDIAAAGPDDFADEDGLAPHLLALEWIAYERTCSDGSEYIPPESLREIVELWRVFQANVFFGYFLETVAAAAADVLTGTDGGLSLDVLATYLCGELPAAEPLWNYINEIAGDGERNEHDLAGLLHEKGMSPRARVAVGVEGLLAGHTLHENASDSAWATFDLYGQGDLWAGSLRQVVQETLAGDEPTVGVFVSKLLDRLILNQHLHILFDKARLESQVFRYYDRRWSAEQSIRVRFQPSRLDSCVNFLADLGLLKSSTSNRGLTSDGKALHRKAIGATQ